MLTRVEEWSFIRYLYVALGPSLMLSASGLITASEPGRDAEDDARQYAAVAPRFLLCLAAVHAWAWLFEPAMGLAMSADSSLDAVSALALLIAATRRSPPLHAVVLLAVALLKVADGGLETMAG